MSTPDNASADGKGVSTVGESPCRFPGDECPRLDREHEDPPTMTDEDTGAVWCAFCPSPVTGKSAGEPGPPTTVAP